MKYLKIILMFFSIVSCEDIIGVENISSKNVLILAPKDKTILMITDVNLSWDAVPEAEQYNVQVALPNFNMASQIILDTVTASTSFFKTLNSGDYQWRVRAENSAFKTSYTTQNFTIE